MAPADVEQRIKAILVTELRLAPDMIEKATAETALLGKGLGIDSMEALTLAAALEREFDIQIPDEDLNVELFRKLGALSGYIIQKTQSH